MNRCRIILLDLSPGRPLLAAMSDTLSGPGRMQPRSLIAARAISDLLARLEDGVETAVVLAAREATADFWQALALITEHAPATAVVAVLAAADPDNRVLVSRCLQAGADDMLTETELATPLAHRTLQRAIERRRHDRDPRRGRSAPAAEGGVKDWAWSRRLYGSGPLAVSERSLGTSDLSTVDPVTYAEIVEEYGRLLDRSLEQQVHWNQHMLSEDVSAFADRLGLLSAGPRDVIEIHKAAINPRLEEKSTTKIRAYVDEGRLLMLEVMGYLVSFYRRLTWGGRNSFERRHSLENEPGQPPFAKDENDE